MTSLLKLEHAFLDFLIDRDTDSIAPYTLESETLDKTKRLKIYYDAYRLRLIEVLQNDYPKLHTLLGDEEFDNVCRAYITTYPSHHFSVRHFGQYLSEFLTVTKPYCDHPYLIELAAFEWAIENTLDAEDAVLCSSEMLHSILPTDWGYLRIQFHPSFASLTLEWNSPQLWKAIENEADPIPPSKSPQPVLWGVWRHGLQCEFRSFTPEQAILLKGFQDNLTFAEVCELLLETTEENAIPAIALGFIQQCLGDGLIVGLSFTPEL